MVAIRRHINGICPNAIEYVLDDDGKIMEFESKEDAIDFLKEHGGSDDEIYDCVFETIEWEGNDAR